MHISIAAETLFHLGPLPVTNAVVMAWAAMALLLGLGLAFTWRIQAVPGTLQNFGEAAMEAGLNFFTDVMGSRHDAERVFPIVATLFLFILLSNWMGLLPGVGSIGYLMEETPAVHEASQEMTHEETSPVEEAGHGEVLQEEVAHEETLGPGAQGGAVTTEITPEEHEEGGHEGPIFVPFFRSVYADLNMTLALAVISVVSTHIFGVMAIGFFKHAGKYFNFSNPINFFVGILELFGEISKMISFSFRLFGNIFAGEVLLAVILGLVPYIAPLPFFGLEVFVGFIQALVFSMLTLVFMKVAMAEAEH